MRRASNLTRLLKLVSIMFIGGTIEAVHQTEYILSTKGPVVIELTFDTTFQNKHLVGCKVSLNRAANSKYYLKMNYENSHVMTEKSVALAAKACDHISGKMGNKDAITFPGTKWCGPGNTAHNFNDLGIHRDADDCCRLHDFCPQTIPPGEKKFGLTNPSPGIISHCNCDDRLAKCLRANRERVSDIIGVMFFNMLGMQCFKEDQQNTKCEKSNNSEMKSCHQENTNGTTSYKLFPAKPYKYTRN